MKRIRKLGLLLGVVAVALFGAQALAGYVAPFEDVPDDAFYSDAVQWAYENGITTGTSATTFEPDRPITRGEAVTMLYRLENPAPPPTTEPPPPTTEPPPPTTEPPPPTTEPPPPTTEPPPPTTEPPPPSGTCSYPTGAADPSWTNILSQRLSPGETLENFVLYHDGSIQAHGIMPPNVENTTVRNGIVNSVQGDNIKLGNNSTYENLYLKMADSGGHLDALQGQGSTGVTLNNITIEMTSGGGVTGAILMQNLIGGGGSRDVTFDFNCVKTINSGPYGHDIRVGADNGQTTVGTLTNFQLDGGTIRMTNRGGTCQFVVDEQTAQYVVNDGCQLTVL